MSEEKRYEIDIFGDDSSMEPDTIIQSLQVYLNIHRSNQGQDQARVYCGRTTPRPTGHCDTDLGKRNREIHSFSMPLNRETPLNPKTAMHFEGYQIA